MHIYILLLFSILAHTTFLHFAFPLIMYFLILCRLGDYTPIFLISTISNFFLCAFFTVHVAVPSVHVLAPYISAGLTTVFYTFPLTLKFTLWSHITPDTLVQFVHTGCVLSIIPTSKSPFSANAYPKYLNAVTLSEFTSPLNLGYTVFFRLIFRPQSSICLLVSF